MAMKCPGCGRDIGEGSRFCEHCGFQIPGGAQSTQPWKPLIAQPPREKSHVALIIGVVIVAIVVILAVVFLTFLQFSGSTATLNIYVNSTHILYSISYNVYVDGSLIDSDTLTPGYYMHYSYTYHWSSSDSTTVTVSASSTGGGLGGESDSKAVTVTDGGTYTINLYV